MSNAFEVESVNQELQQSQERVRVLENILNSIPSMIGYWDQELINRYGNQTYLDYFGKPLSEVQGRHIQEVLGDDQYRKKMKYIQKALKGEPQTFERVLHWPGVGRKFSQTQYVPDIRDGKVQGFFVLAFDISALKKAADERDQLHQQLSENYKMAALGEMAGGVAHEINTPLGIILMNVGMVHELIEKEDIDRSRLKKLVSAIDRTADRISKIVNGLLLFSKDRKGEPFQQVSIFRILDETLPFCAEKFKKHGIDLQIAHVPSLCQVECRPIEISQVLVNLLNNAFDAVSSLPGRKEVSIEVSDLENWIEISVTDNGSGIAPEIQDQIMEPFFTTKPVGKGTGLGLSISKGVIENHEGHFLLDKSSAKTRFVIQLPKSLRSQKAS